MDHNVCLNQNSFPANSKEVGQSLFDDAIQGLLNLHKDNDRFLLYLDSDDADKSLFDFNIAENFTYEDFVDDCEDIDLKSFLSEIEDKSPALNFLSEKQIENWDDYYYYIQDRGVDQYHDVYNLAWASNATLLSINTAECWSKSYITVSRADKTGKYVEEEPIRFKNISKNEHGQEHYNTLYEVDISDIVSPHKLSTDFVSWFNSQSLENKSRIIDKVKLAHYRNFDGGEPLFKTLTSGNGLREIRFSACSGGAIRVLFKHLKEQVYVLLVGFIKHDDSEGYDKYIKLAEDNFDKFLPVSSSNKI